MAKTVPAALATHLALPSTRLVFCLTLEREDEEVFGYTTHDQDLTVDGVVCEADGAWLSQSAIDSSGRMNVDSAEAQLTFLHVDLDDQDVRNGVWDNAQYWIRAVEWNDPSNIIKYRHGRLGNLKPNTNRCHFELRGLMQGLSDTVVEPASIICPARFGDSRCGLDAFAYAHPVTVASVVDQQTFVVQETFETKEGSNLLTNPGHETGAVSPWTAIAFPGSLSIVTDFVHGGTYALRLNNKSADQIYQRVDLVAAGINAGYMDANLVRARSGHWTYFTGTLNQASRNAWRIYRDADQVEISTEKKWTSLQAQSNDFWSEMAFAFSDVPVGTRYIDTVVDYANTYQNCRIDDNELILEYPQITGTPDDIPELDTADYFVNGEVRWFSGDNSGVHREITAYDSGTYQVTCFEGVPHTIQVGDALWLVHACNKTFANCRDEFANQVNFRGQPYRPGEDILTYAK